MVVFVLSLDGVRQMGGVRTWLLIKQNRLKFGKVVEWSFDLFVLQCVKYDATPQTTLTNFQSCCERKC